MRGTSMAHFSSKTSFTMNHVEDEIHLSLAQARRFADHGLYGEAIARLNQVHAQLCQALEDAQQSSAQRLKRIKQRLEEERLVWEKHWQHHRQTTKANREQQRAQELADHMQALPTLPIDPLS